jgi:hypothetical protein
MKTTTVLTQQEAINKGWSFEGNRAWHIGRNISFSGPLNYILSEIQNCLDSERTKRLGRISNA